MRFAYLLSVVLLTSCGSGNESITPDPGPALGDAQGARVLFLRGGPGTGGFLEGGTDDQLSDINDGATSAFNRGWKTLADWLRANGFVVEQMIEGVGARIDLAGLDLAPYAVIVFGSNNADYLPADADVIEAFVRAGGGVLFISDANFGSDWDDAPTSDQTFLDRFDMVMNQDHGTYARASSLASDPLHPLLREVVSFDGEGVSPITVTDSLAGVDPVVLVPAQGNVRRNTASPGPLTAATPQDGALVVLTLDQGRVVGHFDRNTFFNLNGAGTSIERLDNRRYAQNLFFFLAGLSAP